MLTSDIPNSYIASYMFLSMVRIPLKTTTRSLSPRLIGVWMPFVHFRSNAKCESEPSLMLTLGSQHALQEAPTKPSHQDEWYQSFNCIAESIQSIHQAPEHTGVIVIIITHHADIWCYIWVTASSIHV
jgi:hypothetical protein